MEKKIYDKKSEKVIDFLIGLFIPVLFGVITSFASTVFWQRDPLQPFTAVVMLTLIVVAIYLCIKRRYIRIGLLFGLVILPLAFLGTCLLIATGGGFLRQLFWR